MKTLRTVAIALCLICFNSLKAQTMTQESFTYGTSTLNYWLYTPDEVKENLPLLVYLHGGSGKGSDLNNLLASGFPKYLNDGDLGNLDAYVIIPQLAKDIVGWSNVSASLRELILETVTTHHCNNSKVSITGHSMGGTGTWAIAAKFPKLFYRIAPLSGSITDTEGNISALKESQIWAFVGSADEIVDPQSSINFINSLNSATATCTIINGATHFDVPQVYISQDYKLTDWLLGQNDASGINNIQEDTNQRKGDYYDLSGRKVNNPSPGLYIQDKRVVIVR